TDKDSGPDSASFTANVANANPMVTAAATQGATGGLSKSFSLGSFNDLGVNDGPWSVDVNWGDSSSHTTFSATSQGALANKSHTYADNGSYTVSVTVTDKDSGSGSASFTATVTSNLSPNVTPAAN